MLSLKQCLTLPDEWNWGGRVDTPDGPYYHHDNNSSVLGVAHLDTVMQARPVKSGSYVFAPQLDDRLGVWCLLNALPNMGIKLDVLLTTGEEHCRSTAKYFEGRYKWVVEFDRAGTDCVFYHYDDRAWRKAWRKYCRIGSGSYSDIASMNLGVCAVNLGVGYHSQHSRYCYADLNETRRQLNKFGQFYDRYRNVEFPYHKCAPLRTSSVGGYDRWEGYDRWQNESWRDKEGFFDAWEKYTEELA